jgi:hypothetical protein
VGFIELALVQGRLSIVELWEDGGDILIQVVEDTGKGSGHDQGQRRRGGGDADFRFSKLE